MAEPRTGSLDAIVDLRAVQDTRVGGLAATVEVVIPSGMVLSALGLMVDAVVAPAIAGIGWNGSTFIVDGGASPVRWGSGAFQATGSAPIVDWDGDTFVYAG